MTQPLEQTCDAKRIDAYLNDQLAAEEQAGFEAHLSQCQWCQQQIQSRAAEPELWQSAAVLLGQTAMLQPIRRSDSDVSYEQQESDSNSGFQSRQIQSVLDSLLPTDDPEMLGRLDDYEIIGVVGVGGMGAVLKGFDKSLRRVVAIKVMAPHLAGSGSARTRFQREACAAAAITHDNVIDIYSVSEAGGLPYLVMPYARGPSLQKRIDEGGPLSVAEVLRIGRQIAAGLTAAHEQGLVHRDIKPANILLNDGIERLLITDFGVARAMDDASMTRTGLIAGTPQYMSPEQARGESVDYRSDLFSLGSVLYTACTGRPPFRSEAAYGILRRITDDDPRPIREINPDIPEWLCRIIDRLMAKHPADRFQSAAELSELFEGCLEHLQRPTHVALPQSLMTPSSTNTAVASAPHKPHGADRFGTGRSGASFFARTGVWLMVSALLFAAIGFVAMKMTAPFDIAGNWQGDTWQSVTLSSVEEASDWYNGTFTAADGQQGALQLEWSRLQRRYNGRWKLGEDQSGSITLRTSESGSIRGAVSVDPDATIAAETPRLWEFTWIRDGKPRNTSGSAVVIASPVKGNLVWSDGIKEGVVLKKGDRIAEVRGDDANSQAVSQERLEAARQDASDAEMRLAAGKQNREAMEEIVRACEDQVMSYESVEFQVAASGRPAIASIEIKIEAAKQQVIAYEAEFTRASAEYERARELNEQGLTSQKELEMSASEYKSAKAKVDQSKANVEVLENDLAEKQSGLEEKVSRAKADTDAAKVQRAKAVSNLVTAHNEVDKAEADLLNAGKRVGELSLKATELKRLYITVPSDGMVIQLTEQQYVKEGDSLCKLLPENSHQVPNTRSNDPVSKLPTQPVVSNEPTSSVSTSKIIGDNPVTQVFGPVSGLASRLQEAVDGVRSSTTDHETCKGELEKASLELYNIEAKIVVARESAQSENSKDTQTENEVLKQLEEQRKAKNIAIAALRSRALEARRALDAANKQLADVEAEKATIIQLLELEAAAVKRQYALHQELARFLRLGHEAGEVILVEVLKAEQTAAETESKVQQLELLIEMYQTLGNDDTQP